jgi:hypothetical protein
MLKNPFLRGGCDLRELDANHVRTVRVSDRRRAVARSIVAHDQLVRLRDGARRGVERFERAPQKPLLAELRDLVVGRWGGDGPRYGPSLSCLARPEPLRRLFHNGWHQLRSP